MNAINPHLPTDARPGSKRKVRILRARYRLGLPLFHPQDCAGRAVCRYEGQAGKTRKTYTRTQPIKRAPGPRVYCNGAVYLAWIGDVCVGTFDTKGEASRALKAALAGHAA